MKAIEVDEGLMMAARLYFNGASAHRIANLMQIYINAVHIGNRKGWTKKKLADVERCKKSLANEIAFIKMEEII